MNERNVDTKVLINKIPYFKKDTLQSAEQNQIIQAWSQAQLQEGSQLTFITKQLTCRIMPGIVNVSRYYEIIHLLN